MLSRGSALTRRPLAGLVVIAMLLGLLTLTGVMPEAGAASGDVVYRVNAGGSAVSGSPDWSIDRTAAPSPFLVTSNGARTRTWAIDTADASVPAGTPSGIFQSQRFGNAGGSDMAWSFPTAPGSYEVRLYFAELVADTAPGARVFDVEAEGGTVVDDLDVVAAAGGVSKGIMRSFVVSTDDTLDLAFVSVSGGAIVNAIEIVDASAPPEPGDVLARVNVGGSEIPGEPVWSIDRSTSPSPYLTTTGVPRTRAWEVDVSDPSISAGTPSAVFKSQRYGGRERAR